MQMFQAQVLVRSPEAVVVSLGTEDGANCVGADALLATTGTWGLEVVAPTEVEVTCWAVKTSAYPFSASVKTIAFRP